MAPASPAGGARAPPPADDGIDAAREGIARAVDGHVGCEPGTGRIGRLGVLDAAEDAAHGADPREPGVAGEVVAAGFRRAGRRQQTGFHLDESAGVERRRAAGAEPHAIGCLRRLQPIARGDAQDETRALAAEIHLLDVALERDDPDAVEHGCGQPSRPPAGRGHAAEHRSGGNEAGERATMPLCEAGEDRERRRQRCRQRQVRLAIGGEVEDDAGSERHRQPEKEPAVFALDDHRVAEGCSERRRATAARDRQRLRPDP